MTNLSRRLGSEIAEVLISKQPDVQEGGFQPVKQPPPPVAGPQRAPRSVSSEESIPAAAEYFQVSQFRLDIGVVQAGVDNPGQAPAAFTRLDDHVPGPDIAVDESRFPLVSQFDSSQCDRAVNLGQDPSRQALGNFRLRADFRQERHEYVRPARARRRAR